MHQHTPCVNDGTVDVCFVMYKNVKKATLSYLFDIYVLNICTYLKSEGNHYPAQDPNSLSSKV
jgi:hypothetical protein